MLHLLDYCEAQLIEWLAEHQWPTFRAKQIRRWLLNSRVQSFDEMSNLPLKLREQLKEEFVIWSMKVVKQHGVADGTEKLVLQLADEHRIECVLIRERERRTICISTQVGCAMGCVFCASGIDGVVRNLTMGEILEQMLLVERLLPAEERLNHIVVMGMGEPLANLKGLLPALVEASSPQGLGIGARKITISTVGLPDGIRKLADAQIPYHLAVSLHAPDEELRQKLVPVSRKISLASILEAADHFFDVTHRRVTYEYVMLANCNDQPPQARQLSELLAGRNAWVNLIPFNPVDGLPYCTPADLVVNRFVQVLESSGVQVQVRKRKGDKISAACGQLRRIRPEPVSLSGTSATTHG